MNPEAVFLVNKATEQFVSCLALEVGNQKSYNHFLMNTPQASNFMGGRKRLLGRFVYENDQCALQQRSDG